MGWGVSRKRRGRGRGGGLYWSAWGQWKGEEEGWREREGEEGFVVFVVW